jgi:hypothetical protein
MTTKKTTTLLTSVCFAALVAASAHAQNDMPAPGEPGGVVIPPENLVLPNAPKVGDTTNNKAAPKAAPPPAAAPTAPPAAAAAPTTAPPVGAKPGDPAYDNPDWPCVQRKVLTLTSAQIWDGPPVDDLKGWEDDEKIGELTKYVLRRRLTLEVVEKAIKDYAQSIPQGERDKKLTELFASVLSATNKDRQFVMRKVEEFQRRQRARSKELEREGQKLVEMEQDIPPEDQMGPRDAAMSPEQQEYNWNARIFQERQQNLTMACEIPVLIEQRAYEVAQLIRQQMSE